MSDITSQTSINAEMILKNLDGQFINKYILKLEDAKKVLQEYIVNIDDISKRLAKVESSAMREALGEDSLVSKRAAIEATLNKLEVHQKVSLGRLRG